MAEGTARDAGRDRRRRGRGLDARARITAAGTRDDVRGGGPRVAVTHTGRRWVRRRPQDSCVQTASGYPAFFACSASSASRPGRQDVVSVAIPATAALTSSWGSASLRRGVRRPPRLFETPARRILAEIHRVRAHRAATSRTAAGWCRSKTTSPPAASRELRDRFLVRSPPPGGPAVSPRGSLRRVPAETLLAF